MAEVYDTFDEMLFGIDDESNEDNLVSNQTASGSPRTSTWAIDWKNGRIKGAVDGNLATVHRTAKYMMTPRNQSEIYTESNANSYGSYLHTLISKSFSTIQDIEDEVQALCELAVEELFDVESIAVGNISLDGDTISLSFYITPLEGDTEEVTINGIGI